MNGQWSLVKITIELWNVGSYSSTGFTGPASFRFYNGPYNTGKDNGFRVTLYVK